MGAEGQDVGGAAVGQGVAHAQFDFVDAVHHIELGDAHAADAVDLDGTFECGGVEPTAAAGAAGYRTKFMPALSQTGAHFVKKLGGKRAGADTGGVGFHNAQHIIKRLRRHARAGGCGAGHAVGRSNEGIGAAVDVEQRALRAFKQQALAALDFVVERARNIGKHRQDAGAETLNHRHHAIKFQRRGAVQVFELDVVEREIGADFFRHQRHIAQIAGAYRAAGDFVFVGGADAAAGGADFALTFAGFARLVERDVVGQNQRTGGGDFQAAGHVFHARSAQFVDFAQQRFGGNHHARADIAMQVFMQDAAGNQAQHGFFAVHHQRVPGIVAALEAHHTGAFFGQPVYDFAFAFVAPLRADYYNIFCHDVVAFVGIFVGVSLFR